MNARASSPASSGPAGSHFEGQVGAFYLLSLLTRGEPRGLTETRVDTVELQRAAEGRALDDVIVSAYDAMGEPATLEIQVKRSISFTPSDPIFRKVIGQVVEASKRDDFWTQRYELAVATARTSNKIDGPYQDVLTWARQIGDSATFCERIARENSANDDMRTFLDTFRSHLNAFGAPHDDEAVWRLLRRFKILVFDLTAPGSANEALARERAAAALHPEDTSQAGALWSTLTELAIAAAASGGDRDRGALISDPKLQPFRLAGERRFANVRQALLEASAAALSDIHAHVGNVMLTRHDRLAGIHAALDTGRYVEIRGDAGVGKSGLLKHYAQKDFTESAAIVLSPNRTVPNGWLALKAVLGFDGTARDLLVDLAVNGGTTLFLDNLDSFDEAERKTVVDLVRAGETIPGFTIIATMRRNFGIEEPNWLPSEVLDTLGRADPIMIGELHDAEIEEIRHAAPYLAPILSDSHPARPVVRNLFRLSRIANLSNAESTPRTEVEMAEQWWRSADGSTGKGHRDRGRLLKALAMQAAAGRDPMDSSDHPAAAVDALIASETLRDLREDRVSFYHDVLREWAIANVFQVDPSLADQWALQRPAPAIYARAVELAARMALERDGDLARWQALLEQMSGGSVHGSWRRPVLLALVRSEIGPRLLDRVSEPLLAGNGKLLCELIRLVLAVEVEPASKLLSLAGVDPSMVPTDLDIPIGSSWPRLIGWLLTLGRDLPSAAIPSVVDLYLTWSSGMFGRDPLTPLLVNWFHFWLTQIERHRHMDAWRERLQLFDGTLPHDRVRSLESALRSAFLVFCDHTPELAKQYVSTLGQRHHNEDVVSSIAKFRGRLAAAAPAELANLIGTALVSEEDVDDKAYGRRRRGPFSFLDHSLFPASPAQGPFFELLTEAPEHGLALICQLVDHAIDFYRNGLDAKDNSITVNFELGEREFTWVQSFSWSRGHVNNNCVPSALMALEAWGHRRIDAGEPVEAVLSDVVGANNTHAAYLLVAIDLILSHWPESRVAAVPFLGCPELLCMDRERQIHDMVDTRDPLGLGLSDKEPHGVVSLTGLNDRLSRRVSLEQLIGHYRNSDPPALRETLRDLLTRAAERLGAPSERSTFADPALMVSHALNLLDPENWEEFTLERDDGSREIAQRYVPPEKERRHLEALASLSEQDLEHSNMQLSIGAALDDETRSSPAFAKKVAAWAKGDVPADSSSGDDPEWMQDQAVFGAAMIVMRDGEAPDRARHAKWARSVLSRALQLEDEQVYGMRSDLRYNPIAMAFAGLIYALRDRSEPEDVREVLEIAARDNSAAAPGLGASMPSLLATDERMARAILRCALVACIRPERAWDIPEEEAAKRGGNFELQRQSAVDREIRWLAGEMPEPEWPDAPPLLPRRRRGIRLPGGGTHVDENGEDKRSTQYFAHHSAAIWLSNATRNVDIPQHPWHQDLLRQYAGWTSTANGADSEGNDDIDRSPSEWNAAYFGLLARCLPTLTDADIEGLVLERICSLPDQSFFDITALFIRAVDQVYFNDHGLTEARAIAIRQALVQRMVQSAGWKRLRGQRAASIESHIGPAIAALFFNNHGFTQPPACYLLPKGIDQIAGFLPVLDHLTRSGASLFVALVTMNLLEVSIRPDHLPFLLSAVLEWLESYPDDNDFWVDHGIGRRVCEWLEAVYKAEPDNFSASAPARQAIDQTLASLVRLGIADAKRLEEKLAS